MPWATNPRDGVRSYFEDTGGDGSPVLVYTGLADPLEEAQQNPLVRALAYEHRMVFADHRGHGRSDKPHDVDSYALPTRVLDAVAVLDQADVERAHVLGFSWGARLGFAIGEHAPERALSLVLCGKPAVRMGGALALRPDAQRGARRCAALRDARLPRHARVDLE